MTLLACVTAVALLSPAFGQVHFVDVLAKSLLVAALLHAVMNSPPGRLKVVWAFFASSFFLDLMATCIRLAFTEDGVWLSPRLEILATLVNLMGYVLQIFPLWLLNARVKASSDWRLPSLDSLIAAIATVVILWTLISLSERYSAAILNNFSILSSLSYALLNLALVGSATAALLNRCKDIPSSVGAAIIISVFLFVAADFTFDLSLTLDVAHSPLEQLNYLFWAAGLLVLAAAALSPTYSPNSSSRQVRTEENKAFFWWTSAVSVAALFVLLIIQVGLGSLLQVAVSAIAMGLAGLLLVLRQYLVSNFQRAELGDEIADKEAKLSDTRNSLAAMSVSLESLIANAPIAIAARSQDGTIIQANSNYLVLASLCPSIASLNSDITTRHQLAETALPTTNGKSKQLIVSFAKLLDDQGQKSGEWVLALDITEMRLREEQLSNMNHFATLGEITAGLAHEIKQPLNALRITLANTTRRHSLGQADPDFMSEKFAQMDELVHRLDNLLLDVKSFGRVNDETSDFNLSTSIETVEGLLRDQLALQRIQLILNLPHHAALAHGLRLKFEQVLINLINNAADAIRDQKAGGIVKISMTEIGKAWLITVDDDGPGFPVSLMSKLTQAFFTTKSETKGTGLGLSFTKDTLTKMGGKVDLLNNSNGARVMLTVPKTT